ncbi:hypothetical protein CYY_005878 [Polysphondylium violaceum]|uniref:TLDc domain-containing protein n=1 Tax=Polysphondylium violaceum TaxID=133409 RepID=A0A8J4PVB2_9MYCE|nr:hypothetical protein CYY_005878 [Polysphondylium violaceum]
MDKKANIKVKVDSLQRQHQSDLDSLNKEITNLKEKYKCIDISTLKEITDSFERQFSYELNKLLKEIDKFDPPLVESKLNNSRDIIKLNVGGDKFETKRSTFTEIPDTYLEMLSKVENEYFIDRDGKYFKYIIKYLGNDSDIQIPDEIKKEVIKEMEFYKTPPPKIEEPPQIGSLIDDDDNNDQAQSTKTNDAAICLLESLNQKQNDESPSSTFVEYPHSKITNQNSFKLFSEWINGDLNLNFELLYRASEYDFDISEFHNKCDGKGATITVIETVDGDIFGGYNSQSWSSQERYCGDQRCFIFTLVNKHGIKPTKYIATPNVDSIFCYSSFSYGVTFGGGHDFRIEQSKLYQNFPKVFIDTTGHGIKTLSSSPCVQIKDYEVFLVV